MIKLTKREKTLLYLLALLALVAGMMMLVISPAMDRSDALDQSILEAQVKLDEMHSQISRAEEYRSGIRESRSKIAGEAGLYLPAMTDSALDRYITTLVQSKGLRAEQLTISASDVALPSSSAGGVRVDVTARGTLRQFVTLAQKVKETDGIRIADMTLKRENAGADAAAMEEFSVLIGFAALEYTDTVGLEQMTDTVAAEG